jgi:hypothetical protein
MVATAISRPAAEVLGWFQIFEMEFMRNAPYKNKKDGRGRPGLRLAWNGQARPKAILCNNKPDREAGIARPES